MARQSKTRGTSPQALRERVREIIQRELDDARAKTEESWYWGNVGPTVRAAAEGAWALVESVPLTDDPLDDLHSLILKLQARRTAVRASLFDEDGYALATYHMIIRDVLALYRAAGGTQLTDETDE
ncbi:hypothetical protein K8B33_15660 [Alcanivorax sp. JB21]|uniref:hypothetical protein n=1 Tax=Alcanivorax limicola TaxID=2874102 RepID=UPI001CBBAAB6|nr:hypothetical protein [Alcanivorax limicola]MBZ2190546.1 hypothetical protein [Alcanivorax limicola]